MHDLRLRPLNMYCARNRTKLLACRPLYRKYQISPWYVIHVPSSTVHAVSRTKNRVWSRDGSIPCNTVRAVVNHTSVSDETYQKPSLSLLDITESSRVRNSTYNSSSIWCVQYNVFTFCAPLGSYMYRLGIYSNVLGEILKNMDYLFFTVCAVIQRARKTHKRPKHERCYPWIRPPKQGKSELALRSVWLKVLPMFIFGKIYNAGIETLFSTQTAIKREVPNKLRPPPDFYILWVFLQKSGL